MDISVSVNISYCIGVERTLKLVEELLAAHPKRQHYMLGEIVHNEHVINGLKSRGLRVVNEIGGIPEGAHVIIQSHGVSRAVMQELRRKKARVIDATCPMVKAIHKKIQRLEKEGYFPVIIGREGHDEVRGIAGQVERSLIAKSPDEITEDALAGIDKVGVVVQSTFIRAEALAVVDRLRELALEVKFEDTICRPTTERQEEVCRMADEYDCIVIVGSRTSANTRHLYKLASGHKACVYLVDHPDQVDELDIPQGSSVFITSGASTPMYLVEQVISHLYTLREFHK